MYALCGFELHKFDAMCGDSWLGAEEEHQMVGSMQQCYREFTALRRKLRNAFDDLMRTADSEDRRAGPKEYKVESEMRMAYISLLK